MLHSVGAQPGINQGFGVRAGSCGPAAAVRESHAFGSGALPAASSQRGDNSPPNAAHFLPVRKPGPLAVLGDAAGGHQVPRVQVPIPAYILYPAWPPLFNLSICRYMTA